MPFSHRVSALFNLAPTAGGRQLSSSQAAASNLLRCAWRGCFDRPAPHRTVCLAHVEIIEGCRDDARREREDDE